MMDDGGLDQDGHAHGDKKCLQLAMCCRGSQTCLGQRRGRSAQPFCPKHSCHPPYPCWGVPPEGICLAGRWQCCVCSFIWAGFGVEGALQVMRTKTCMSMTIQPLAVPVTPRHCFASNAPPSLRPLFPSCISDIRLLQSHHNIQQ